MPNRNRGSTGDRRRDVAAGQNADAAEPSSAEPAPDAGSREYCVPERTSRAGKKSGKKGRTDARIEPVGSATSKKRAARVEERRPRDEGGKTSVEKAGKTSVGRRARVRWVKPKAGLPFFILGNNAVFWRWFAVVVLLVAAIVGVVVVCVLHDVQLDSKAIGVVATSATPVIVATVAKAWRETRQDRDEKRRCRNCGGRSRKKKRR